MTPLFLFKTPVRRHSLRIMLKIIHWALETICGLRAPDLEIARVIALLPCCW